MSALAHDIKTPLTIVRGNAELLSETELTPEQKNNVTYVLNGTTQIQSYPEPDWMYWSCNHYHCSCRNSYCKITAYETDMVLCDVQWSNAEDSCNGSSKNYCQSIK